MRKAAEKQRGSTPRAKEKRMNREMKGKSARGATSKNEETESERESEESERAREREREIANDRRR